MAAQPVQRGPPEDPGGGDMKEVIGIAFVCYAWSTELALAEFVIGRTAEEVT